MRVGFAAAREFLEEIVSKELTSCAAVRGPFLALCALPNFYLDQAGEFDERKQIPLEVIWKVRFILNDNYLTTIELKFTKILFPCYMHLFFAYH